MAAATTLSTFVSSFPFVFVRALWPVVSGTAEQPGRHGFFYLPALFHPASGTEAFSPFPVMILPRPFCTRRRQHSRREIPPRACLPPAPISQPHPRICRKTPLQSPDSDSPCSWHGSFPRSPSAFPDCPVPDRGEACSHSRAGCRDSP